MAHPVVLGLFHGAELDERTPAVQMFLPSAFEQENRVLRLEFTMTNRKYPTGDILPVPPGGDSLDTASYHEGRGFLRVAQAAGVDIYPWYTHKAAWTLLGLLDPAGRAPN